MTKTLLGTAVGALALGSLVTAQALKAPSTDASESRLDAYGQPAPYSSLPPVLASYSDAPIARPAVQTRTVYRDRPATRTASVRQPTTQVRSWKKSALIIGGSAAGGAAVGAVIDGGSGAKKGAVIGGVAGTVYDIATRSKTQY